MTSIGSPSPFFFGGKKAHAVDRSLRFNDNDTAYLSRTPSSAGNRKTWTLSWWVKLCKFTVQDWFSCSASDGSATHVTRFDNNGRLNFQTNNSGIKSTNAQHRDPSAWYHFLVKLDTTNSTADDRCIIYVNGVRQSLTTNNTISQNTEYYYNTTQLHTIGVYSANQSSYPVDCYMAEMHFLDGTAYDPSYFGKTDSTTGQWIPKKYTGGNYGTNGFYLDFSDTSALGKDSSGNNNNWTPNNFSTSAGEGNDSVLDTPTTNYCTLNPLDKAAAITFKNGNLQVDNSTTGNYDGFRGTFGSKTGKYYWEIKFPSTGYMDAIGIARADGRIDTGNQPTYRIVLGLGSWYNSYNSGGVATYVNATPSGDYPSVATWSGASNYSSNDVYMIAVDFGAGKIWWGKNNSWFNNSGTANPATGTDPRITFTTGNEWFPYSQSGDSSTSPQAYNFGQQGFAYTPPSGFVALNSENLPDPTIKLPNKHFDNLLYTGNAGSNTISGLNFSPDWVWGKGRNLVAHHFLADTIRGVGRTLRSDSTTAEIDNTSSPKFTSFTSDGFSLNTTDDQFNGNSNTYVAWNWNAGDTDGKTYTVTVVDSGGNKFRFDGFAANAVTLDLAEGGTYIFNYPSGHPFRFSTTSDGTHGGGSEYTTGVTHNSSTQVTIVVAASAPQLYYYCASHSGMGGQINTNSSLGSSNFDGSIQAKAKVNASAGFSIVSYTGTGSSSTVGHGLGVAPDVLIIKNRTTDDNWVVYHKNIDFPTKDLLYLNLTVASEAENNAFDNTAPSSSVFTVGSLQAVNKNTDNIIAYCFNAVEGYSKFGSYTGNGSYTDGTFIFTNFRPSYLLVKNITSGSTDWVIKTAKITPYNVMDEGIRANSTVAEESLSGIDFLSNGFKIYNNGSFTNTSGDLYIYLCFAESPFKNARAR